MLIQLCVVLRIVLTENQHFTLQRIHVTPCRATKDPPGEEKADVKPLKEPVPWDASSHINSLWRHHPSRTESQPQIDDNFEQHHVVYRPPKSLTRLAKTPSLGFEPYFDKGFFEPFERRPKPVTLVGLRKNGQVPRQKINEVRSKSSEIAELQSPYNDVSSFWLDEPGRR